MAHHAAAERRVDLRPVRSCDDWRHLVHRGTAGEKVTHRFLVGALERRALTRVSIFMNVFDVHVNRSPVDAEVAGIAYRPGKFFNASLDKASEENERNALRLRLSDGRELAVVQIAGLVARRIRSDVKQGGTLQAGERFGMIRFGSRVDVYLPDGVAPLAIVGQRAVAGETVIADLVSGETQRRGATR